MNQEIQIREHFESADEFIRESEHLISGGFFRGAIGRSYYAMFHAATAVLLLKGIERSSHHGILAAFGEFLVKPGLIESRFHAYIREAFLLRNECDYLSMSSASKSQAQEILAQAKEFVQTCRQL